MTIRPLLFALPLSWMLASSASAAFTSATIIAASTSLDCLAWRIVGVCYWLYCTPAGCRVRTSVKVRHYVPDAVVSAYTNTGENPWTEVSLLGTPNVMAQAGGDSTTNHANEDNNVRFKETDVIGNPGGTALGLLASSMGLGCKGATLPLVPYMLSTLDPLAWRYGLPEAVYPEALVPGMREVGGLLSGDMWGNIYPRAGHLYQVNDYKAAAVFAQRAGDITTRSGQPHVYVPMLASSSAGYWPAGALLEGDESTGKWQELTPRLSRTCGVFPNSDSHAEAEDGAYAWALWRPYSCCKRRGQVFLGSTGI